MEFGKLHYKQLQRHANAYLIHHAAWKVPFSIPLPEWQHILNMVSLGQSHWQNHSISLLTRVIYTAMSLWPETSRPPYLVFAKNLQESGFEKNYISAFEKIYTHRVHIPQYTSWLKINSHIVIIRKVRFLSTLASASCCWNLKQLLIQIQHHTSYDTSSTTDIANSH